MKMVMGTMTQVRTRNVSQLVAYRVVVLETKVMSVSSGKQ
jgi:hypothetical protein